ncbi:hypothetical protein [Planctomicrobium sp. SH664]|uniref:hypothetical protein n=1 Tax=Planctomicrobium sp. SH664 TaxID=3448125 RepID=UPI003F5C4CD3
MNLRDLADLTILVCWHGTEASSPLHHAAPGIATEFWKYSRFLEHSYHKTFSASHLHARTHTPTDLIEELFVVGTYLETLAACLEVAERRDPRTPLPEGETSLRERIQQAWGGLLITCRQQLLSVPTLLKFQRLERRFDEWKGMIVGRVLNPRNGTVAESASGRGPEDEFQRSAHYEGFLLTLELAAYRRMISNQSLQHPVREAVYAQLSRLGLSLISPRAFDGQGLLRSRLHRRIEEGCVAERAARPGSGCQLIKTR